MRRCSELFIRSEVESAVGSEFEFGATSEWNRKPVRLSKSRAIDVVTVLSNFCGDDWFEPFGGDDFELDGIFDLFLSTVFSLTFS